MITRSRRTTGTSDVGNTTTTQRAIRTKKSPTSTKKSTAISPTMDDVLSSWVLDALRKTYGYGDIRNKILEHFIKNNKIVAYGKTFGVENTESQLKKYLAEITETKTNANYLLFTASNKPYLGETHYQTFVLDFITKQLWVIDPASVMGRSGIYASFVATETIIPFFKSLKWKTSFVQLTNPCQTTMDDIFCQTWSLYLQIQLTKQLIDNVKNVSVIVVPKSLRSRYRNLNKFYKDTIGISGICKELKETYKETIKTSPYLILGKKTKKEQKDVIQYFLSIDPCVKVKKMNELDLMTEAQRLEK